MKKTKKKKKKNWSEPESSDVLEIIRGRQTDSSSAFSRVFVFLLLSYRPAAENLTNAPIPAGRGQNLGNSLGDDEWSIHTDLFITSCALLLLLVLLILLILRLLLPLLLPLLLLGRSCAHWGRMVLWFYIFRMMVVLKYFVRLVMHHLKLVFKGSHNVV